MSYSQQLRPWCVVRVFTNDQRLDDASSLCANQSSSVVARFRRQPDAVAYLQVLEANTNIKSIKFLVTFDMQGVSGKS